MKFFAVLQGVELDIALLLVDISDGMSQFSVVIAHVQSHQVVGHMGVESNHKSSAVQRFVHCAPCVAILDIHWKTGYSYNP